MTDEFSSTKVYFDTNIFRDAFEGEDDQAGRLKAIFEVARQKPKQTVTSELTLAELLGIEIPGRGWAWQTRFYLGLIVFCGFVDLRPITREILLGTGDYRRAARQEGRSLKLADAIHVVTAIKADCQYVFTADRRFVVPHPLEVVAPDLDGVALIKKALDA